MSEKIDILIAGSGGREHALGWKLAQSPRAGKLIFAPGNAGTAGLGENVAVSAEDVAGLVKLAGERQPGLVVVGPEVPLALGLADELRAKGFLVVGPSAEGAQIEASKAWAKLFMERHNIPTAAQRTFNELEALLNYLENLPGPYVLKADGLAAGKGVLVTRDRVEAQDFARSVMDEKIFGDSGAQVLVEEFMEGPEVSALAFCDTGSGTIIPMEPACDYKRVGNNDAGLNTGGMGAYSPTVLLNTELRQQVLTEILQPALRGFQDEGIDYRGILYAGLMLTSAGPKVVEFNCRFGDPETQVILPRLKTDLLEIFLDLAAGKLAELGLIEWDSRVTVGVVLAAGGYPGSYRKGLPVSGLGKEGPDIIIFHAGTALSSEGQTVTSGGRVFNVISIDESISLARQNVYNTISSGIPSFEGAIYRSDIAKREEKS